MVREIRGATSNELWRYVPSARNPADLPSRGCNAKKLLESQWWKGPDWLREPKSSWFTADGSYDEAEINKEKKRTVTSATVMTCIEEENDWYYKYFSNYKSIVRLIGWIMRFKWNSLTKDDLLRRTGELTADEIIKAEKKVLFLIQKEVFLGISDPKLSSLQPYLDEDGLIRLKTKISYGKYEKDFCYPIVLPNNNHPVVQRLILDTHRDLMHAGSQTTLASLRRSYWILGGRRSVRSVVRRCVICQRYTTKRLEVQTPPLPVDRIREAKIFEIIGIDFAGPVYIRGKERNTGDKVWICLFTCAIYRAVHLELVSSLSTERFLQCLRRFIGRRGRPKVIYTDNGTNFVGAANVLERIDWRKIEVYGATLKIRWKFNPPTAAWWGGWWERLIGLMKQLLRRVLGKTYLDFKEMQTMLCECETIINARPLTYVSEDSSDLVPLTPDMFLKEIDESGAPDLDAVESTDLNRRMNYRQQLRQTLRERFRSEYLGQLILHARKTSKKQLEVGEVVLIENENSKRLDWPLARVVELIPGSEGTVRLVKLRTKSGFLLRPIQRIFPLELEFKQSAEEGAVIHHAAEKRSLSEEDDNQEDNLTNDPVRHTRSGRVVKVPSRMNL